MFGQRSSDSAGHDGAPVGSWCSLKDRSAQRNHGLRPLINNLWAMGWGVRAVGRSRNGSSDATPVRVGLDLRSGQQALCRLPVFRKTVAPAEQYAEQYV